MKRNIRKMICLLCVFAMVAGLIQGWPTTIREVQASEGVFTQQYLEAGEFYQQDIRSDVTSGADDYFGYNSTTDTYTKVGSGWENWDIVFLFTERKYTNFVLNFDVMFCEAGGVKEPEVKIEFGKQNLAQGAKNNENEGAVCLRLLTDKHYEYYAYVHEKDAWGNTYDDFRPDELHHVRVLVKDGKYSVFMDNLLMIDQFGLPENYRAGYVGIGTGAEEMSISNIKISNSPSEIFRGWSAYSVNSIDTFWLGNKAMVASTFDSDWNYCGNGMIGRAYDGDTKAVYSSQSYSGDMIMDFDFTARGGDNTIYVGVGATLGGNWLTKGEAGKTVLQESSPTIIRIHETGQVQYAPTDGSEPSWWFSPNHVLYDTVAKQGAVHSCQIRISGSNLTVIIDGYNQGTIAMQNYKGGYVFLGGWTRAVSFSLPTITTGATSFTTFEGYISEGVTANSDVDAYSPSGFTKENTLPGTHWEETSKENIPFVQRTETDGTQCAALYLKDRYTTNIRLSVTYTSSEESSKTRGFFIGFGADTKGAGWDANGGSQAANVVRVYATGQCGFAPSQTATEEEFVTREIEVADIADTQRSDVHNIVVEVRYNTCYVWLDGTYRGSHALVNYKGGYIFLAAYGSDVSFSIPTVERIEMTKSGDWESKANEKRALFLGDGISYGKGDLAAWANRLGYHYGMTTVNNSVSDAIVAQDSAVSGAPMIINQIPNDDSTYDYVIIEGGINDIMQNIKSVGGTYCVLGEYSDSKEYETFATNTFAGGLDNLFYKATTQFGDAAVGYIMTYQPTETWIGNGEVAKQYVDMAKKICKKWNVSYLCLWDYDDIQTELFSDENKNIADGLHTSVYGYNIMDPIITKWFSGLSTKKGYVNDDKYQDLRDLVSLILIEEECRGGKKYLASADYDNNGVIDAVDAKSLRNELVVQGIQ